MAASGWPHAIAPPYGLSRSSSGEDADAFAPRQHLHGERLVQLEEADVVDRRPACSSTRSRRRDRADPHQLRLDAGEREADEAHARLEAELLDGALGGEQRTPSRRRSGPPSCPR